MTKEIEWFGAGRKARQAPNPNFPHGVILDLAKAAGATQSCTVDLTYPASEVGAWRITCQTCGLSVGATAAGRPDDPRQVVLPCWYSNLGQEGALQSDPRVPYKGD